jgi:hypothetical protein
MTDGIPNGRDTCLVAHPITLLPLLGRPHRRSSAVSASFSSHVLIRHRTVPFPLYFQRALRTVVGTLALTDRGVEALHAVGVFRAAAAAVVAAPRCEEVHALCHNNPRHAAALPAHEPLQVDPPHASLFP